MVYQKRCIRNTGEIFLLAPAISNPKYATGLMKGIFDAYVLWPFGKKIIFELVTRVKKPGTLQYSYFLQFSQNNTTVCLIIHLFCKICFCESWEPEIILKIITKTMSGSYKTCECYNGFLPIKSWKNTLNSCSEILIFFLLQYYPELRKQPKQINKFMRQNVPYRPTVYKTRPAAVLAFECSTEIYVKGA